MAIADYNPFAKRSEFSRSNLLAYKILTILSWLLVVLVGAYYTFNRPEDSHHHGRYRKIWEQNSVYATPFALNAIVTSIYWVVTLVAQLNYIRFLWSSDTEYVNSSANVGSHFILNNLFIFGFIHTWVRGHFWPGEIILIANLVNLTALYFRNPKTPLWIHAPVVSFPYAWNYVAILWDGAAAVHAHSLPARILANLVIWGILVLGGFFLITFKDWTIGLALTILSLSLALAQLATKVIAFQWIFAFVITGVLALATIVIAAPGITGQGRSVRQEGAIVSEDREREPLLDDRS